MATARQDNVTTPQVCSDQTPHTEDPRAMAVIPNTPSTGGVQTLVAQFERQAEEQSYVYLPPSARLQRNNRSNNTNGGYLSLLQQHSNDTAMLQARLRYREAQAELKVIRALKDVKQEELVQLRNHHRPLLHNNTNNAENRFSIMTVSSGYGSRPNSLLSQNDRFSFISIEENEFPDYEEEEEPEDDDDNSSSDYHTPPDSPNKVA